jgi:hypothetical protein
MLSWSCALWELELIPDLALLPTLGVLPALVPKW